MLKTFAAFALLLLSAPSPAYAQGYSKEIERLDVKSIQYSDTDLRQMVANVGWQAHGTLWRLDGYLEAARALLDSKNVDVIRATILLGDLRTTVNEINMTINVLPKPADPESKDPNMKRAAHFEQMLFAARKEAQQVKALLGSYVAKHK